MTFQRMNPQRICIFTIVAATLILSPVVTAFNPSCCCSSSSCSIIRSSIRNSRYNVKCNHKNHGYHNNNNDRNYHDDNGRCISRIALQQAADAWTGGGGSMNRNTPSFDGTTGASQLASGGGYGSIEQIEFKIYPDGRVEERVHGIKGNNCHSVTAKINEQLGEVIATSPTEEMYEQEVQLSQTLYNSESSDWSSSSSW
jgi:Protein of unknown function (DUF2997)